MRWLVVVLVLSGRASADPELWDHRFVVVDANTGYGNPYGLLGASVELAPASWFAVEGGAGVGRIGTLLGDSGDYTVGLAGRLRSPGHWGGTASAGVSMGDWKGSDHPFGESPYAGWSWARIWWANTDVGVEHRWEHWQLRVYLGLARELAAAGYRCEIYRTDGACPSMPRPELAYGGIAVGRAFAF